MVKVESFRWGLLLNGRDGCRRGGAPSRMSEMQDNLSWYIDKQSIDNKTVMHTDVLVYSWSLRMSYSFYVVEKLNACERMLNIRAPLA